MSHRAICEWEHWISTCPTRWHYLPQSIQIPRNISSLFFWPEISNSFVFSFKFLQASDFQLKIPVTSKAHQFSPTTTPWSPSLFLKTPNFVPKKDLVLKRYSINISWIKEWTALYQVMLYTTVLFILRAIPHVGARTNTTLSFLYWLCERLIAYTLSWSYILERANPGLEYRFCKVM